MLTVTFDGNELLKNRDLAQITQMIAHWAGRRPCFLTRMLVRMIFHGRLRFILR
jgi:hypothetical protein